MPTKTIDDLKKISRSKVWKTLAKRMVITANRESMFIYFHWHPKQKRNEDDNVDDAHNTGGDTGNSDITIDNSSVTDYSEADVEFEHDSYPSSMSGMDENAWKALINDETNDHTGSSTDVLDSPRDQPYLNCRNSSEGTESNEGEVIRFARVHRSNHFNV